ncbi:hypothetical protein ELD98_25825, partial [Escherichia coli]|nr:hypothetical protein [Escherichia coli]
YFAIIFGSIQKYLKNHTIQPQGMDKDSNKAFQQYILVKNPYRNAVAALIYASFIKCKRASSYQ